MVWTRKKKLIVFLIITALAYYYFNLRGRRQVSDLLEQAIEFTESIWDAEKQLKEALEDDTYDRLIKEEIVPASKMLSSATKQTEIMEGLARIPGGPTNFMATTIKIINKIQKDLHSWEKQYKISTSKVVTYWPSFLRKIVDKYDEKLDQFKSQKLFIKPLAGFQIYFEPREFLEEDVRKRQESAKKSPLKLQEIINVMKTELIPLVKKFEELKIERNQSPMMEVSDVHDKRYSPFLKELMDHLAKYDVHYETIGSHWRTMIKKLKKLRVEAANHIEKSRRRYEKLEINLDNDIDILRERILDLRNPRKSTHKTDEL